MVKLTKAQSRALKWFHDLGRPAIIRDEGYPALIMRSRLADMGLVKITRPVAFGFVRTEITSAGRSALSEQGTET